MIRESINGITEYDAFGNMTKYFIEYPEIYLGNEEIIEAKKKEVIATYERDQQEAERERVRKEAQYLQDLENIRQHELKGKEMLDCHSITPEYLDEFWNIDAKSDSELDIESFLKVTNFQKIREDLDDINCLLYFGAGSYDKFRFWFLKKAVSENYLKFIPNKLWVDYVNDTPEETKMKVDYLESITGSAKFDKQLQSEVEEVARNLRESLLIFHLGDEQELFLIKIIREMVYSRYNEAFNKLFTYAVLLLTQLQQIEQFSAQQPPPDMEALLSAQNGIRTPQIIPQASNGMAQRKPSVIVEQASRAAFVAIFDTMKKQGIVGQMKDNAVAKLIGAKSKETISAARSQKDSLSKKLYGFVLSLLQKAKLDELEQLEKDIKKIKADRFSNDAPLR